MLVGDTCERVKAGTFSPREDDTFHILSSPWSNSLIWVACAPVPEFRHAQNHRISLGIQMWPYNILHFLHKKWIARGLELSLPVQLHATA
jgi:hypothetical protein